MPLARQVLADAGCALAEVDLVAYTRGPGLAGALLVGAGVAVALAAALGKPALGVHHLEGHLLSPFLGDEAPAFPFVALLVSGGHTQLMQVEGVGRYALLGETIDDAAGEAFDKSAKLLGLGYPGGPALARLADFGDPAAFALPRPLLHSGNLDFSFAGLKTAVMTQARKLGPNICEQARADLAASTQAAIVDVLVAKSLRALQGQRPPPPGGGRRRRCQPAPARTTRRRRGPPGRPGLLPAAGAVHRQRRHDRAGRRAASAARAWPMLRATAPSTSSHAGRWTRSPRCNAADDPMREAIQALPGSKIREVANAGLGRDDVLAFWFGESDEVTPEPVRQAAAESLARGETFYSHNLGLPELRAAIAAYAQRTARAAGRRPHCRHLVGRERADAGDADAGGARRRGRGRRAGVAQPHGAAGDPGRAVSCACRCGPRPAPGGSTCRSCWRR